MEGGQPLRGGLSDQSGQEIQSLEEKKKASEDPEENQDGIRNVGYLTMIKNMRLFRSIIGSMASL
jgi:hypothetical protein